MPEDDQAPGAPCIRVRGRIEAFVDGGLAPLEQALDAGHLEACAACAEAERKARALLTEVGAALGAPVDTDWLHAGLGARLDAARPPRRPALERVLGPPGDRAGTPVLVAAAALLLLFGLSAAGVFDGIGATVDSATGDLDGLRVPSFELIGKEAGR
ncbi:MAG: hypothetical protein AAFZ65_01780 [Planctomycetota bacterium]